MNVVRDFLRSAALFFTIGFSAGACIYSSGLLTVALEKRFGPLGWIAGWAIGWAVLMAAIKTYFDWRELRRSRKAA